MFKQVCTIIYTVGVVHLANIKFNNLIIKQTWIDEHIVLMNWQKTAINTLTVLSYNSIGSDLHKFNLVIQEKSPNRQNKTTAKCIMQQAKKKP